MLKVTAIQRFRSCIVDADEVEIDGAFLVFTKDGERVAIVSSDGSIQIELREGAIQQPEGTPALASF